jgi:adenylosuccinate lyase
MWTRKTDVVKGNEMLNLFSERTRISTWRSLWIWLAESQKQLGLDISQEALDQMKAANRISDEEFTIAREEEAKRRHDVMAHVHTFGLAAPAAAGKILGALHHVMSLTTQT